MMAGIVDLEKRFLYCGATIITTRHVLTAAHCVERYKNNFSIRGVIVGNHKIWTGLFKQSKYLNKKFF